MADEDAERGKEEFLSRWSRLKEQARQAQGTPAGAKDRAPAADPGTPAPELPPIDKLTPDSDFRAFFHPKVGEDLRRAALRKLFSDPRFNVMDGLDVYIDDYSRTEPIPPAMLAGLKQAQKVLEWAREDAEERKQRDAERIAASRGEALEPPAPSPSEIGFEQAAAERAAAAPGDSDKPEDARPV